MIFTLETTFEHIRKRPAMYIESLGVKGLCRIFENSVKELNANGNISGLLIKRINIDKLYIEYHQNNPVLFSFNEYLFSLQVIISLCKNATLDREIYVLNGKLIKQDFPIYLPTQFDLCFDDTIVDINDFLNFDTIYSWFNLFSYNYPQVYFDLIDDQNQSRVIYHHPFGMLDLYKINSQLITGFGMLGKYINLRKEVAGFLYDIVVDLNPNDIRKNQIITFANGKIQNDVNAITYGIFLGLRKFILKNSGLVYDECKIKCTYPIFLKRMNVFASVFSENVQFAGSTCDKVANKEIVNKLKVLIYDILLKTCDKDLTLSIVNFLTEHRYEKILCNKPNFL